MDMPNLTEQVTISAYTEGSPWQILRYADWIYGIAMLRSILLTPRSLAEKFREHILQTAQPMLDIQVCQLKKETC